MKFQNYIRSKGFKYGSIATALTIVFVALIIIFNTIFTQVASKFSWYSDLTSTELFTLSDEAKSILSTVDSQINIYFTEMPDVLDDTTYKYYVYSTAKQIAEECNNVNVECHDVLRENKFFEKYKLMSATTISASSVIVESGDEFVVYSMDNFYIFNEEETDVWAYNGEYKFLSGILQVTSSDTPLVCFTTGHGEDIDNASALISLFKDAGFEVKGIDLTKENVSDDCRILVVYNPIYDFIGIEAESESANEIQKIDDFLDSLHHGCLMTFIDSSAVSLMDNLNEFLEEWGIQYEADTVVRDYENSISVDGKTIVAKINEDEEDFASGIYTELLELSTLPKSVIKNATSIKVLWPEGGDLFGERYCSSLLTSNSTAEILVNNEVIKSGETSLMAIGIEKRIYDNTRYYSYVIATSPSYVSNNYLVTNTFANKDIINAAVKVSGKDKLLANIDFKVFENTELNITTAQANKWTIAMTLVLPITIAVIGLVIWVRRKHS